MALPPEVGDREYQNFEFNSFSLVWGGRRMDLREDGEVLLDGCILGTDPEIFLGLQKMLTGVPKGETNGTTS